MAVPAFAAAGTGAASTTSTLAVPYPAGISAGHLLILHVLDRDAGISSPAGWTQIDSTRTLLGASETACWYKVATGSESGSQNVTVGGGGNGAFGRMYRFTGASTSTPVAAAAFGSGSSTTISDTGVTTVQIDSLAVQLVAVNDDIALASFTGETGGDWTEAVAEFSDVTGADGTLQLQTADMASVGTVNGGTMTGAASTPWGVFGFAIQSQQPYAKTGGGVAGLVGKGADAATWNRTGGGTVGAVGSGSSDQFTGTLSAQITFGGAVTSVSGDLQSFTIRRGRQFNLDRVEAATADVVLVNGENYDPANVDGPYYGQILPLIDLRLRRLEQPSIYPRFHGPIERWLPQWIISRSTDATAPREGAQNMQIGAADGFQKLANVILESDQATLTTALAGSNNDLVFTAVEHGEAGDNITITYTVAGLNTSLTVGTNDPLSGNAVFKGELRESQPSMLGGFGRTSGATRATVTPVEVTVNGTDINVNVATNGAGAATSTASQIKTALEANADVTKLVTIALAPGNDGSGVVTAMAATNLSGGKWPEESSGARITRVLDEAGWSASLRDIDAGSFDVVTKGFSKSQNVSALAHIQEVADSELGYVFMDTSGQVVFHDGSHRTTDTRSTTSQATFSDDGVGFPYVQIDYSFDCDRIYNDIQVTPGYQGAQPQVASDATSQTAYGKRTLTRATQLVNDADALLVATAILDAYKDPATRFDSITLLETDAVEGWAPGVFNREIGDLVTVRTNPPAHTTTVAYDCFIEAIEEDVQPGLPWRITFRLSSGSLSISEPPPPSGGTGALKDSSGDDFVLDSGTAGILG